MSINLDDQRMGLTQRLGTRYLLSTKQMKRRTFLELTGSICTLAALQHMGASPLRARTKTFAQQPSSCMPGWQGTGLIDGNSLANWTVEHDAGASGTLELVPGLVEQAVQLTWDLGSGNWAQGKYTFPTPVDLSQADIFGISLHGGGTGELATTVSIMVADVNDVFYGYTMEGKQHGINQIDRWLMNCPLPKKLFSFFFNFGTETQIDWSQINRFFFVVKKVCVANAETKEVECFGGGAGQLKLGPVRYDSAATWPRQTHFEGITADLQVAAKAISYLLSQQDSATGLFVSWQEEEAEHPPAKSWLYDQALVLIALTRAGNWHQATPTNGAAQAAQRLTAFITSIQKTDGHWARAWKTRTGEELVDDGWVGDQAWWVMALALYSWKSQDSSTMNSAQHGADWLAHQIDSTGKVVASTEGNVDVWWAMIATGRIVEACKLKNYLLHEGTVWDPDLRYWWRGSNDPLIALDAATWLSAFARHPLVNEPERGKAALSLVRKALVTSSKDGSLCGFDGMGPVSLWNEGTAQYVAAGGEEAQTFLAMLIAQQNPDGSMRGSPEKWSSDAFGWLTTWRGLAPTAWLYFAITGTPFPLPTTSILLPHISRNS